jgi:hypothetical protein
LLWDEQDQVLVTGGEDGKIHVWPGPSPFAAGRDNTFENDSMDVDMEPTEAGLGKSAKRTREREIDWDDNNGLRKNGKRLKY